MTRQPTQHEIIEFLELKRDLFPDGEMFVAVDFTNPRDRRYNELAALCLPYFHALTRYRQRENERIAQNRRDAI